MATDVRRSAVVTKLIVRGPTDFDVLIKTEDGVEHSIGPCRRFGLSVDVSTCPVLTVDLLVRGEIEVQALTDVLARAETHEELIERDRVERQPTPPLLIAAKLMRVVDELQAQMERQQQAIAVIENHVLPGLGQIRPHLLGR